jgi:hypothetical protein
MKKSEITFLGILSILMVVVFKRTPNEALGHLYHPDKEEEEEFEGSNL